ncbi:hypothetical protein AGMMS49959_16780 [Planctomycetales bacterium]|nr:hypothetical protein AGMMS49959_16780 [Planctomycetales bacterium]
MKKFLTLLVSVLAGFSGAATAADEWGGDGEDYRVANAAAPAVKKFNAAALSPDVEPRAVIADAFAHSDEWGGDGDDYRQASAGDGRAVFNQMFGSDFKVDGGSLRYAPDRRAVIIRDYATVTLQGRKISARNIVYFVEVARIYAEGDVKFEDRNGSFLTCEQVYFDVRDWRGRALGVKMRGVKGQQEGPITEIDVTGKSLDDLGAERNALLGDSAAADDDKIVNGRINIAADDMRVISRNHFEATRAWASPSNYAEPHWRISSGAAHVRPDEKVEAWDNWFKIGKVPVFYLPYLVYDLRYNWPYYRPSYGSNSKQGIYGLNRFGWNFSNPTDADGRAVDENGDRVKRYFQLDQIFIDGDYRSLRGWGVGGETDYSMDFLGKGKGNLKLYEISEIYTMGKEDRRRAEEDVEFRSDYWSGHQGFSPELYANDARYLIEWQHAHQLDYGLDLRANLHRFSDRDFYKEYFPDYWARSEQKLTNVDLRYLGDVFSSDLAVQMRLNEYRSETEYLPRWQLNLPGFQLIDGLPVYFESKTEAAVVRRRTDEMLRRLDLITPTDRTRQSGDTPWIGRLNEDATLAAPIDIKTLTVRPWVGGFMTGYSEGYNPATQNSTGGEFNAAAKWGVDLSTRFFGYFDNFTHLIEPQISWLNHESPVRDREKLYELDAIDNYRQSRMLMFNLHQDLLKNKAGGGERVLASANLRTGMVLDDNEAKKYNNNHLLADVALDASLYPTETWSLWGNTVYSPAADAVTSAAVGTDFWFSKRLRFFLKHYYNAGYDANTYEKRYNASNTTSFAVRTQLWDKLSHYAVEYGLSYQWNDSAGDVMGENHYLTGKVQQGLQRQRISLIRDLDTFDLGLTYAHDHVDNDWTVYVSLTPKNWAEVKRAPDTGTSVKLDQDWNRYSHPVPEKQAASYAYDTSTPAWK